MEFHEAANLFPLDDEHIDELADDIRKNGQHVAIELLDGKILDGRRRFLACRKAGRTPETIDVSPDDPIAYVLSLNLQRRHLSASQKAMIGDKARALYDRQAKERQKLSEGRGKKGVVSVPHLNEGKSRDLVGKAVGVGGSLMDRARKVREKGTPELVAAVEEDRMSVSMAAKLADANDETQRKVAKESQKTGGRYRQPSKKRDATEELPEGTPRGVGMLRANEAINCLMRIPKNDRLRKRGFQAVKDWIRRNP